MHACVHACVHECVPPFMCLCMPVYACVHVCVYNMRACMCACMCVCIFFPACVCVQCTYTFFFTLTRNKTSKNISANIAPILLVNSCMPSGIPRPVGVMLSRFKVINMLLVWSAAPPLIMTKATRMRIWRWVKSNTFITRC